MKASTPPAAGWTRRHWVRILGVGLVVHVLLVVWLGERAAPVGVVGAPEPVLRWAAASAPNPNPARAPLMSDPTLFALPSAEGFSGEAWLAPQPAPAPAAGWTEAPRFLPLETNELGADFARYAATNKASVPVVDELLRPRPATADILLLDDPLQTQTLVRVEGPLASRPVTRPAQVPDPDHPDALEDTRVLIRVNRDGFAESAIVMRSCGVKKIDEAALAAARGVRFAPLPQPSGPGLAAASAAEAWGEVVFQWLSAPHGN